MDVSIPCPSCNKPIRFGERECLSCHTKVTEAEQHALNRRLEASSSDYRELRNQTDAGRTVMLIAAAFHFLLIGTSFMSEGLEAFVVAAYYAVLGCAFAFATWFARRNAVATFLGASTLWLALQVMLVAANPLRIGFGLFPQLVVLALLGRATFAALRIRTYLANLKASSSPRQK